MHTLRVGLVGVTGYTGMELARLLVTHPTMELTRATSRAEAGRRLDDLFPGLAQLPLGGLTVTEPDMADMAQACDLVFLAVPHGAAMDLAADLYARGAKVVDLSADFRLKDPGVYAQWYGLEHRHPELLPQAVFGLPELNAAAVSEAQLVANPGCYPTSVILGLIPALSKGLVRTTGIVADSKSGATGAGRKASQAMLFCEVADTFKAYNLGKHRHTPEIEQELSAASGRSMTISFNTHLLPLNRGILSTMYTELVPDAVDMSPETIHAVYSEAYAHAPWVRVLPLGRLPETRYVRGTMFCDIGLVVDPRTKRLIVVTAIDNLCRGASGQALANANLMCGLAVDAGLTMAPLVP